MSLKTRVRRLENRMKHLNDILSVKLKVKNSINVIESGTLSDKIKSYMLKGKKTYLKRLEFDENKALKDIEKQAKSMMKKYSKKEDNEIDLDTYNELRSAM